MLQWAAPLAQRGGVMDAAFYQAKVLPLPKSLFVTSPGSPSSPVNGGDYRAPKSREILMFVSKKMPNNAVIPQCSIVFIVLVNSHQR